MSTVAESSAVASASVLKRQRSDDSSGDEIAPKRYFYVLANESTEWSSEGTESVYSVQDKSTDLARDTSDTSSKSSFDSNDIDVEFEVASLCDSDLIEHFPPLDSSSSPEDLKKIELEAAMGLKTSDSSSNEPGDSGPETDSRLKFSGRYQFCIRCKSVNMHPHFPYCFRCHRLRKSYLPEKPKHKKSKKEPKPESSVEDSGLGASTGLSDHLQDHSQSSVLTPPPSESSNICNICLTLPKNGAFCHGRINHVYACYSCSMKVFKNSGRCPVCNVKVKDVARIIVF